jgi:hypothetical protein
MAKNMMTNARVNEWTYYVMAVGTVIVDMGKVRTLIANSNFNSSNEAPWRASSSRFNWFFTEVDGRSQGICRKPVLAMD